MSFSIVTTCMGRAAHLRHTMPGFLTQDFEDYDIYVVDWSSPDDLLLWLDGLRSDRVHVVSVPGREHFHLSAARNAGGRRACEDGARYLAFIDADILLPPDFLRRNWRRIEAARCQYGDRFFLQTRSLAAECDGGYCIWGSCIAPATIWEPVQYCEAINTYGHEDNELYSYWLEQGCAHLSLDVAGVRGITHTDEERVRYYPEDAAGLMTRKQENVALFRGARGNLMG